MGWERVSHPSTLRMQICPEASRSQSSMGTVWAQGRTVWVLMRRRNSSLSRSMALVGRADFHCDGSRRVKANSRSPFGGLTRPHRGHGPPHPQSCRRRPGTSGAISAVPTSQPHSRTPASTGSRAGITAMKPLDTRKAHRHLPACVIVASAQDR